MLKGHVFEKQVFGNQIFALFINTFLNGANGVSNNYRNGMAVTYSGSTLTVQSGAVCVQGRFLEEDTSTNISAGTETAYCKLVIEVNLDSQNTESDFTQAKYKIVTSSTGYPSLTQNDIVANNSGIYQYELARFRTGTNGITEFSDRRTFLDFDSIYTEIKQHIQDIDDGSLFVQKSSIETLTGTISLNPASDTDTPTFNTIKIDFPTGFDSDNCVPVSWGIYQGTGSKYSFGCTKSTDSRTWFRNALPSMLTFDFQNDGKITFTVECPLTEAKTYNYKIVLMKIS